MQPIEPQGPLNVAEAAARYARHGFAVFPAYTIEQGACSCGQSKCSSPGKHPIGSLVPHGVSDALADEQAVREWWAVYPDANVCIATGDPSGIVVVDVDLAGFDTIGNLERLHGEIPATWSVETGSGGMHLYYRSPNHDIRNSAGAIGPGIDIRGNGGYVVAPPSLHISGSLYRWETRWGPTSVRLAEMPDWLIKRMVPAGQKVSQTIPRVLKEGMRNTWLASAAGTMRRRGFGENAIKAAIAIENRERCKPPLEEREVERIARSISRYNAPEDDHAIA